MEGEKKTCKLELIIHLCSWRW